MKISDRYRELTEDVRAFHEGLKKGAGAEPGRTVRLAGDAALQLAEFEEQVGEIPRIRLEAELTPVLLRAHGRLDQARLLLEEEGAADAAGAAWDLEQKIYRLLNDL